MSSREQILKKLRQHLPPAMELPALDDEWTQYEHPLQQFSDVLSGVGGTCWAVDSMDEVQQVLSGIAAYQSANTRVSLVPGAGEPNLDLESIPDPHELEHVDFAVLPGAVAVAENAAIWVNDTNVRHRVLYFVTQHLALVVPRTGLVSNMHEAYERIEVNARPFGAFISGPSKTADIEQSLVIGAHGARSLSVFLVDNWSGPEL
ncbi:MAG: LUD domain-containing protein [Planctomycetaceae bacterium]|nr:LUD domain-containing protein [Planctomycetaceae bacterium]